MSLPGREAIDSALALVRAVMPPTPQQRWPLLDARTGAQVWVKHENHTPTGAFKVRGGLNLLAGLASATMHMSWSAGFFRQMLKGQRL